MLVFCTQLLSETYLLFVPTSPVRVCLSSEWSQDSCELFGQVVCIEETIGGEGEWILESPYNCGW